MHLVFDINKNKYSEIKVLVIEMFTSVVTSDDLSRSQFTRPQVARLNPQVPNFWSFLRRISLA